MPARARVIASGMRWAALRQIKPPVGTWRDRLQASSRGGSNDDGKRRFGVNVSAAGIAIPKPRRQLALSRMTSAPSIADRSTMALPCANSSAAGVTSTRLGRQSLGSRRPVSLHDAVAAQASPRAASSRPIRFELGWDNGIRTRNALGNRATDRPAAPESGLAIGASKLPCSAD
jgi:hypothetical protein